MRSSDSITPAARDFLDWPFFDSRHAEFAARIEAFADAREYEPARPGNVDRLCRALVAGLGAARFRAACVPGACRGLAPAIESRHLAPGRAGWAARTAAFADARDYDPPRPDNVDRRCRALVAARAAAGWLAACVPGAYGGLAPAIESRRLALAREALAYRNGLADFAFA